MGDTQKVRGFPLLRSHAREVASSVLTIPAVDNEAPCRHRDLLRVDDGYGSTKYVQYRLGDAGARRQWNPGLTDRGLDRDADAWAGSSTRKMTDSMAVAPCVITLHPVRIIALASPSVMRGRSVPSGYVPRTLPCLLYPMYLRGTGCHVIMNLTMSQTRRGYTLETLNHG